MIWCIDQSVKSSIKSVLMGRAVQSFILLGGETRRPSISAAFYYATVDLLVQSEEDGTKGPS